MSENLVLLLNRECGVEIDSAADFDKLLAEAEKAADWMQAHAAEFKDAPECARRAMQSGPIEIDGFFRGDASDGVPDAPCLVAAEKAEDMFGATMQYMPAAYVTADVIFDGKRLEVCFIDMENGPENVVDVPIADVRAAIAAGPVDFEDGSPKP